MYENAVINFLSDNTRLVVGACQGGGGSDAGSFDGLIHTAVKHGAVECCACVRADSSWQHCNVRAVVGKMRLCVRTTRPASFFSSNGWDGERVSGSCGGGRVAAPYKCTRARAKRSN